MVSKEEFNKVFEATSRDGILNQFYYEHIELIELKQKIDKAIEYIMTELITEWDIKNDGYVSGSDLPVDAITPILNILNGSDEE